MCGIFGVIASGGRAPSLSDAQAERCRDSLAHRGPDGAGLWRSGAALLTHRRLAVIDLSPAGAQPMHTPDGRFSLVYNGELYNDAEVRGALAQEGVRCRTGADAETVLLALARWGANALPRFRGMFALALWDSRERRLLLARDPLGVKPLYFAGISAGAGSEIAFASEPTAILAHPAASARPNLAMVSAYCTTIRTVLGADTMFEAVSAVEPGQVIAFDMRGDAPAVSRARYSCSSAVDPSIDPDRAADLTRDAIERSVHAHLRADVPVCALLSGGLDSTIIAALAAERIRGLRTFAAGAAAGAGDADGDIASARRAALALGVEHDAELVTPDSFARDWAMMVNRLGVPLSTPNEVAIHAVAARLRAAGCVVALSGEGADELFGGYEAPLLASLAHVEARRRAPARTLSPGAFELRSAAWMEPEVKPGIIRPDVWSAVGRDEPLTAWFERTLEACAAETAGAGSTAKDSLDARLRFHRAVNLTGLLQRLDSAAMLAGVEGRTPFADAQVAALAESLPMACKFAPDALGDPAERAGESGLATLARPATKRCLRDAFASAVPPEALERPKASFPLPFQAWLAGHGDTLRESSFARAVFTDASIEAVAADPSANWRLAWPMLNIARWGDRWWGG